MTFPYLELLRQSPPIDSVPKCVGRCDLQKIGSGAILSVETTRQGESEPMNKIERGRRFVQRLVELAGRVLWQWRRCPHCESTWTCKNGDYTRRPWSLLGGRQATRIQRHLCHACGKTYAEERPGLVRGSWYKREVHRLAVDQWVHMRCSLRRTAEMVRSLIGHQERWQLWHVWEKEEERRERCYLSASTVGRWLGSAGKVARKGIQGQWAGVENSAVRV